EGVDLGADLSAHAQGVVAAVDVLADHLELRLSLRTVAPAHVGVGVQLGPQIGVLVDLELDQHGGIDAGQAQLPADRRREVGSEALEEQVDLVQALDQCQMGQLGEPVGQGAVDGHRFSSSRRTARSASRAEPWACACSRLTSPWSKNSQREVSPGWFGTAGSVRIW